MLKLRTEGGYLVLCALFLTMLVVQTDFTETPKGIDLVSILHLFEFHFLLIPSFELQRVSFLSHDFVCESSSSHSRLVIVGI